ncbi:helicase-related protein [Ralstonia pseudosolanacearum]|uniref:helicase-related protein n=2 Tax=Ralstonia pseudosolanacearum TaxID=1310165 RepID=UPI0022038795|nr:hypothetical protein NHF34_00025 [Ralstonia solanacearum]
MVASAKVGCGRNHDDSPASWVGRLLLSAYRSNTQARLDRQIQGDTSVYDYYPYQVISIDFIKSDARRDVFIEQCPELLIVDEAHTCARPAGASASQQQRYHLISRIAAKPDQHLVMLTATPHSGKSEEFQSLLGLLRPEFEAVDLPSASQAERRELAKHFVQRKRGDVEKWLGEDTPFPKRDAFELNYKLSLRYLKLFGELIDFSRKLVAPVKGEREQRVHYWTALGLLRGVMSSPAAGVEMLTTRLSALAKAGRAEEGDDSQDDTPNPVGDTEFGYEADNPPTQVIEHANWTEYQRRQLRDFADRLQALAGPEHDLKLAATAREIGGWLKAPSPFCTVVFCRYIETAKYVGEHLEPLLRAQFPKLDLQVITSELPDELRKQRIDAMGKSKLRVLIATDCLSEGINLQDHFTAVLHYDLPWNPNRLEQREGRVDRFGQAGSEVKACLLYGADNPIDGVVLDVLLRKVREIKRSTGINVPFPEDSQSIIDTITQALLLNPNRQVAIEQSTQGLLFDFADFEEAATAKDKVTYKLDEAAAREKASRSIFAQHAIKAQEIEADLREVDEAIGDPKAVETFVTNALNNLMGVQITPSAKGYRIITANLAPALRETLPQVDTLLVSFQSPTPENHLYLGRNHPFVELLCQVIMANTIARQDKRAARAAVIRTQAVAVKTTLLLFRCRNVIEQSRNHHQIVAEEMLLWGWRGTPQQREFLDHSAAKALIVEARASSDLSPQARASFLTNELDLLDHLDDAFKEIAEGQSKRLVEAHERFSALMDKQRFQVVYPVLPMDLLGMYVLLPEAAQ